MAAGPYCLTNRCGTVGAASVIVPIAHKRAGQVVLTPFGEVGRTAFSNYILTSPICQTVFVRSGLGLYGCLVYYQSMFVVLGLGAVNLIVSPLWLRFFAFGPLEWLWRSLTYVRWQPFRATAVPGGDGRVPAARILPG